MGAVDDPAFEGEIDGGDGHPVEIPAGVIQDGLPELRPAEVGIPLAEAVQVRRHGALIATGGAHVASVSWTTQLPLLLPSG
jgi:hypothetical protein